jgi:hypothetical protein
MWIMERLLSWTRCCPQTISSLHVWQARFGTSTLERMNRSVGLLWRAVLYVLPHDLYCQNPRLIDRSPVLQVSLSFQMMKRAKDSKGAVFQLTYVNMLLTLSFVRAFRSYPISPYPQSYRHAWACRLCLGGLDRLSVVRWYISTR